GDAGQVHAVLRSGASLSASCCFNRGDIDLFHFHHRLEGSLSSRAVGVGGCFDQCAWSYLPGQAPFVLTPATGALDSAIPDDGIPIAIGLGLVFGDDLKRKGLAVFESRTAVQTEAGHAHHRKLDREHLPLFAARVIAGGTVDGCYGAVRKG